MISLSDAKISSADAKGISTSLCPCPSSALSLITIGISLVDALCFPETP
jgi:hypothetical protein